MSSDIISEIAGILFNKSLDDILITGFIEKDTYPLQFHASYRTLYLDCAGVFLKASVIRDEGELSLCLVDRPVAAPHPEEEDFLPTLSSIRDVVLTDPNGSNSMVSIHLWNVRETGSSLLSAALRIDLGNGQRVFADPSYIFGIRLGGAEQEKIWNEGFRRPDWDRVEIPLKASMTHLP
jgi:hypothetical protein